MQKGENFNHPARGTEIRVGPIKRNTDIRVIEKQLSNHPRNHALFTLGIRTGLRPGELLNIKVGEVECLKPMNALEVKEARTENLKRIILDRTCIESIRNLIRFLTEQKAQTPSPSDFLFRSRNGSPISVPALNNLVKKWCLAIDLKGNYGGHSLRKTYGYQQLFRFGVSVKEIMVQLGHSKRQQTFHYLCLTPEEIIRLEPKNSTKRSRLSMRASKEYTTDAAGSVTDIRETEGIYRVLFENANDGIVLIDTEGKVLAVNEANGRIFGWTREEVMGKSIFELGLIPPENEKRKSLFKKNKGQHYR